MYRKGCVLVAVYLYIPAPLIAHEVVVGSIIADLFQLKGFGIFLRGYCKLLYLVLVGRCSFGRGSFRRRRSRRRFLGSFGYGRHAVIYLGTGRKKRRNRNNQHCRRNWQYFSALHFIFRLSR